MICDHNVVIPTREDDNNDKTILVRENFYTSEEHSEENNTDRDRNKIKHTYHVECKSVQSCAHGTPRAVWHS